MGDAREITPVDVLAFWVEAGPDRWFAVEEAFDTEIRRRFLGLWQAAADGELSSWEAHDGGALALVIVLDQFPRNMFRGDRRAYATDVRARDVAIRALERDIDMHVDPALRGFLYMPLMHSENVTDQERCVELFRTAGHNDLKYAERHAGIIRRFGRFPHRNPILGRATTPQEQAFLDSGGFRG
jgi:uncharacterized protein (DUF924 family)